MAATQTALQAWNFCEFITGLGLLISSSDEKDWNGLPEEDADKKSLAVSQHRFTW